MFHIGTQKRQDIIHGCLTADTYTKKRNSSRCKTNGQKRKECKRWLGYLTLKNKDDKVVYTHEKIYKETSYNDRKFIFLKKK